MRLTLPMMPLAAALLLPTLPGITHAASVVPDFNISGVPDAGFPHFEDKVKLSLSKSGKDWKFTAVNTTGTQLFQKNPTQSYNITSPSFSLTALFDSSLNFKNGTMAIKGKIPSLGVNSTTNLWTATLSNFGFDINPFDGSPISLGWKTTNMTGWGVTAGYAFGTPESVYLYNFGLSSLANMFYGHHGSSFSNVTATALTTVPVPAAVLLLGSGLIALFGLRRRNHASSTLDEPLVA
ncbi:MAG: VPLPA-CTERM sorting domain-containing protein [Pseudomonadota bacterium]